MSYRPPDIPRLAQVTVTKENGTKEVTVVAIERLDAKGCSRNDPCHCGSGKKFKRCCISKVLMRPIRTRRYGV